MACVYNDDNLTVSVDIKSITPGVKIDIHHKGTEIKLCTLVVSALRPRILP